MRGWWRRRALGSYGLAAVLGAALGPAAGAAARAAELRVRAPARCIEAATVAEQVGGLLGQPLESISGVDFELEIEPAPHGWRLRLDMIDVGASATSAAHARRSRELAAASCPELADVAAVAIAMSIRSLASAPEPAAELPPPASRAPAPKAVTAAAAAAPPAALERAPRATAAPSVGAALAVGVLGDAGALPHVGLGAALGASLRFRRVWLAAEGAVFAAQEARGPDGAGGDFRLVFGAALGCIPYDAGRFTLSGCLGFELGRLSGEGVGVRPRAGSATWEAPRAEVGIAVPVSARVTVVVRVGAAVPLARPEFVIDGATPVHRPGAVSARAGLGLELAF